MPYWERFLTETLYCCFTVSVDVAEAIWRYVLGRVGGGDRRALENRFGRIRRRNRRASAGRIDAIRKSLQIRSIFGILTKRMDRWHFLPNMRGYPVRSQLSAPLKSFENMALTSRTAGILAEMAEQRIDRFSCGSDQVTSMVDDCRTGVDAE